MKIWFETAADHSANLRIVGRFRTAADAGEAADLINELLHIVSQPQTPLPPGPYSKEVLDFTSRRNFSVSPQAVESAQYYVPVTAVGDRIEVLTDELEIQIFIEAFIRKGAKIEIYSKHDYP